MSNTVGAHVAKATAGALKITVETDDGVEHVLPTRFEVCPRCQGRGTHTNPSIDGHGITSEEMDELGDDFREDYMSGVYDVDCGTCGGARVVAVVDEDRCDPALLAEYQKQEEDYRRDYESERYLRMAESGERW